MRNLKFALCLLAAVFCLPSVASEMSTIYKFKDWEIRTDGKQIIAGTISQSKIFSFFGFSLQKGNCDTLSVWYLLTSPKSIAALEPGSFAMGKISSEKVDTTLNFKVASKRVSPTGTKLLFDARGLSKDAVGAILEHDSLLISLLEPNDEVAQLESRFTVFSLHGSKATLLKMYDTCSLMTNGEPL